MRRRVHLVLGFLAFFLYSYLLTDQAVTATGTWPSGLVATLAGSLLPDIIEPATSANHRGFFHSRGIAKGVGVLFLGTALLTCRIVLLPVLPYGYPVSCLLLGYLCHLLADSMTPRGLP